MSRTRRKTCHPIFDAFSKHDPPALHEGDSRSTTLQVYVDGELVTTWTSSGKTSGFETIKLPGSLGQSVELRGVLGGGSEWLHISKVHGCVSAPRTNPETTESQPQSLATSTKDQTISP